ncbi:MAG: DUF4164 family protein [Aaplasma endosymbiont of Hyalomma asiaticum]
MEEIEEFSENLRLSFDRLQSSLAARLELECKNKSDAQLIELKVKVDELAARNVVLENELHEQKKACEDWKVTCSTLVGRLNASIEIIKSVLEQEKGR